jgi:mRNA-degrading endonuclease RelE of RelBE toxin-antitoxin system
MHFMALRPLLTGVVVTKRFFKDLKDDQKIQSTVVDVLDCSNLNYHELHKFEEIVGGALVFRAKKDGAHMVYAVDKQLRLIFLRVFRNFSEYGAFLEDKQEIKRMVAHA